MDQIASVAPKKQKQWLVVNFYWQRERNKNKFKQEKVVDKGSIALWCVSIYTCAVVLIYLCKRPINSDFYLFQGLFYWFKMKNNDLNAKYLFFLLNCNMIEFLKSKFSS